jgi:hypothetical protein
MSEGPLNLYRTPAGIVFSVLGLAVLLGGAATRSGVLFLLGLLTVLFGTRAVEFIGDTARTSWRERWGRMLDRLSDPTCLLLTLVGSVILLVGLWGKNDLVVAIGLVVVVAGHFYLMRTGRGAGASGSGGAASAGAREGAPGGERPAGGGTPPGGQATSGGPGVTRDPQA